jgi:acetyl esterase
MNGAPRPESIEDARMGYDRTSLQWVGEAEEVAPVTDEPVGECCVRVYEPLERARGAILWIHGGGWIMGNLTSYDPLCRALANRTGAVVVSVDYRLAPESPYPGPVDDSEAALRWLHERYPDEPLAIAGDSAGGNLATVVARRVRGSDLDLRMQVLLYPPTDAACGTSSYQEFGADGAYGLEREQMLTCWSAYAPGLASKSPEVSPLRAPDLSGLPPALLVLAECDPLTDEATDYADRLRAAGVDVEVEVWPGMIHGFVRFRAAIDDAHAAMDQVALRLRDALAR